MFVLVLKINGRMNLDSHGQRGFLCLLLEELILLEYFLSVFAWI